MGYDRERPPRPFLRADGRRSQSSRRGGRPVRSPARGDSSGAPDGVTRRTIMAALRALWRRVLFHLRRDRFDAELEEEFRFHLELKTRELVDAGIPPSEAKHEARRQFGNLASLKERSDSTWNLEP